MFSLGSADSSPDLNMDGLTDTASSLDVKESYEKMVALARAVDLASSDSTRGVLARGLAAVVVEYDRLCKEYFS